MHFSAKRGLAIACRPSVCLSVTLVISDHIGWKSWKLIVRAISLTPSLIEAKRRSNYSQRNMGEILGDKRWGRENGVLENKSASISETRKDGGKKLLWTGGPIGTHQRSFEWCHPRLLMAPFLKIGGLQLSYSLLCQEQVMLRTSNLAGIFTQPIRMKAH